MLYCVALDERAKLPTVSYPGEDLGFDLYSIQQTILYPNFVTKVRTGISARFVDDGDILVKRNFGLVYKDRSSMASLGITISGGVIDSGYSAELIVLLTNHNTKPYIINAGDKIVQMIPVPVETANGVSDWVQSLPESKRAEKGFGSTGK